MSPSPHALVAAFVLAALQALAFSGCATFGREACEPSQRALGVTPTPDEQALVQRLLVALSTRDFEAFQSLQPSQQQYLAVAWRHGEARADSLARAIQRVGESRRAFTELGDRFVENGLEARRATRCVRRMAVNGDASHPLYALSVDVGPFSVAVPVYRSADRTSLAGSPVVEEALHLDTMARAVGLQVGLLALLERANRAEEALLLLGDYLAEHAAAVSTLRERLAQTPWSTLSQTPLSAVIAPFHADYGHRWQELQQNRFPAVFEAPAFIDFAAMFYPPGGEEPGEPSDADGDEPSVPETGAEPAPADPEPPEEAPKDRVQPGPTAAPAPPSSGAAGGPSSP
jgi:hypothetical protein